MLLYNLPAIADNDVGTFLNCVARPNNFLEEVCTLIFSAPQALLTRPKTAESGQILAARVVLRDRSTGKFPRCTLLPPSSPSASSAADTPSAGGDGVLSRLRMRSEPMLCRSPSTQRSWVLATLTTIGAEGLDRELEGCAPSEQDKMLGTRLLTSRCLF